MILKKTAKYYYMPKYSQYDIPDSDTLIDFSIGQPSSNILGIDIVKDSLKGIFDSEFFSNEEILQYSNIKGVPEFRKNLANWINIKLKNKTNFSDDNLMILNGITGCIQIILESMYFPGEVILVEESTYFIMLDIFKDYGLKVDYIPISKNGIDMNILAEKLMYLSENQDKIFLYMIPFFHNPLGITINSEIIDQIRNIFDMYDNFYVLSDEVYYYLSWNDNNILPLSYYHKNFISIGSFSKMIGPSLRLGYILSTNEDFLEELEYNSNLKSSGGISVFSSVIVNNILSQNSFDKFLENIIDKLKKRHDCMIKELEKANTELSDLNITFKYSTPNGGYFLLVELVDNGFIEFNKNNLVDYILDECKINKVSFLPGEKFTCSDNENLLLSFRLSFSLYDEEDIVEGIKRIVKTLKSLYKVRIVTFGGSEQEKAIVKQKINNFSCLEDYVYLNSDCSNLEDIKISKYNKTIFIDLNKNDEINTLMKRILDNLDDLGESKRIFHENLMIISSSNNIDMKIASNYSQFNPIIFVKSYSKIDLINDKVIKFINQLYNEKDYKVNDNESLLEINSNDYKLLFKKNDDNSSLSTLIYLIFCILGKKRGINYFDENELQIRFVLQEFLGKRVLIIDENDNFTINDYIKKIILSDKFFGKLDGLITLVKNENMYMKSDDINFKINFFGNKNRFHTSFNCLLYMDYLKKFKDKNDVCICQNTNVNTVYNFNCNNNIFLNDVKKSYINYNSTLSKVKEKFTDYEFVKLNDVVMIDVSSPTVLVYCDCNLSEIDKCILSFIKNSILEKIPKNFSVIFLCLLDKCKFMSVSFDKINITDSISCLTYLLDKKLLILENDDYICTFIHYDEEEIIESSINLKLNSKNSKNSIIIGGDEIVNKAIYL